MSSVTWLSGAYTDLDGDSLVQMGAARGRAMDICSYFPDRNNSAGLRNTYYLDAAYTGGAPAISLGIPMCYDNGTGLAGSGNGTLAQDLSADMTALANTFKADGRIFYIRLGWEFNLPSWPWAVTDGNVTLWKTRFATYANIFKSIMGAKVHIVLNPNAGANQSGYSGTMANLLAASTTIDHAGPDQYDWFDGFTSDAAVADYHTTTQGLDFWATFCRSNGLKLCIPEWGCVSGSSASGHEGGDNPRYITEMVTNWMVPNADIMGFDTYFNETQDYLFSDIFRKSGDPGAVSNPNAWVRYKALFAGGNQSAVSAASALHWNAVAGLSGGTTRMLAQSNLTVSATASMSGGSDRTFPAQILPIRTEIQVNGAWTNITSRVRAENSIVISRGDQDENSSPSPATLALTLNNRDGLFSPRNPMSPYYGLIGRNTPIRTSVSSAGYAQITQATTTTVGTCYVSAPDTPATSIVGDLDVRFDADLTSWRDIMALYSKWTATGNQRSYLLYLASDGRPWLIWSTTGTNLITRTCTVPVAITTGRVAIRATLDVDNGASGHTVTFYTAPTIAGAWTQLGDTITFSGTTSIFNSTAPSFLLDNPGDEFTGSVIHGRVYAAEVRAGINGTVVASPTFSALAYQTPAFVDAQTNPWTLAANLGSLEVRNFDPRFVGEVTEWPQTWDTTGTDVYTQITCADVRRRLAQGAPPIQSAIRRTLGAQPGLVAYWPAEDAAGSTSIASGIARGRSATVSGGDLSFAADSSFLGSASLPTFQGALVSGPVKSYTSTGNVQVRALIHIDGDGTVNGAVLFKIFSANAPGGASAWALSYGTGGTLTLTGLDSTGTAIGGATVGPIAFGVNGQNIYVEVQLQNQGSNVAVNINTLTVATGQVGGFSTVVNSLNIGRVTSVGLNTQLGMDDVGFGHVSVQTVITALTALGPTALGGTGPMSGYVGEAAEARIVRLSAEQGIALQSGGFTTGVTAMGAQSVDTYLNLIQECADADGGILFSPRDWLAIAYRPQVAFLAQPADLVLDYSAHQMMSLEPTEDDQHTLNDVTVSRTGGSSSRAIDTDSTMSSLPPPNGVGTYATSTELNVATDDQLADQAGWRLHLGTIDEARYPTISVELAAPDMADLQDEVAAVDVGSRLVVTNPPAWIPPDDISQLVRGYTETMSQYSWVFVFNCTPASPFDTVGVYGSSYQASRYSSDGSFTAAPLDATSTALSVDTPSGPLWDPFADPFDFDIMVAGERMTVTDINLGTTPQAFTVVRSVNGVVKSHDPGEEVNLFAPAYYAL